eukprot:CAMPEP_0185012544 /NCGR_PEP_ID=MMETSP1098-20130426/98356_1 /TAXON_ID=89044 /ORGANISM="Spumella elongata, Strain CCAP 955/1" /LENGTH=1084 /DNA_ID=CAMNT_0027541607 /DNA_START=122 /DNA_END=3379 /DNA_ORIENTATION=-
MKRNASAQKDGSVGNLRGLNEFGLGTNTLTHYLLGDEVELKDGSQVYPKQLRKKHFVPVLPEKVPTPSFIAASKSCAHMLELDPTEFQKKQFTEVFSGNELLPGLDVPYATVYGCHSFGQWFGQLGDGRALSIGDVYITDPPNEDFHRDQFKSLPAQPTPTKELAYGDHLQELQLKVVKSLPAQPTPTKELAYGDHLQELQLKGCGRSPFSRGFDGRAVLRSSVREYLVSEAMYHLGVPTTRALSLIGTGMEIARPWYAATSTCNNYTPPQSTINNSSIPHTAPTSSNATCVTPLRKFAPDYLLREPGVVLCRVSRSFLRVGQLELFAIRREYEELTQLADFVCFREFPVIGTGMEIARPWYAATSTCNNYTPPQPTTSNNTNTPTSAPTSSNATCITPLRKFAPDYLLREPGAVLCRVSRSFLRVGQLELFAMRREYEELTQLADFVCFREFPELLKIGESPGVKVDRVTGEVSAAEGVGNADAGTVPPTTNGSSTASSEASILFDTMDNTTIVAPTTTTTTATTATTTTTDTIAKVPTLPESLVPGPPERYVEMFRLIAQRNAALVADWLRVGYVQGNMNSDNTLLAGRTIDYGPYGWMERYDPLYQPFTTDRAGNFAFSRQPAAMGLNVGVLGETTIAPLVQHVYMTNVQAGHTPLLSLEHYLDQVTHIFEVEYAQSFGLAYDEVKRRKLGLFVQAGRTPLHSLEHYLDQVTHIFEVEYAQCFGQAYDEVKRRKLGLFAFDAATTQSPSSAERENEDSKENNDKIDILSADQQLWLDLELLMAASDVDFTILFRELGKVAELLVGPDATHSSESGSSTSTISTSTSAGSSRAATMFVPATAELSLFPNIPFATNNPGSSRAATMFVPATAELSLFPNIPFATEQSQTEPGHTSTAAHAATTVSPDRSVVDSSAPVAGELEDLLLDRALALLGPAFYNPEKLQETRPVVFNSATSTALTAAGPAATGTTSGTDNAPLAQQWTSWLHRYQHRLLQDAQTGVRTAQDRRKMMDATNPKYVLRNWMAAMAYERSEQGDHSIIHELSALLEQPYDEQSTELQQRWYAKTPDWAQNLPGVTFMSCSS